MLLPLHPLVVNPGSHSRLARALEPGGRVAVLPVIVLLMTMMTVITTTHTAPATTAPAAMQIPGNPSRPTPAASPVRGEGLRVALQPHG